MMKLVKNIIAKKWFYLYLVPFALFFSGSSITFWNVINLDTHYTVMPIVHINDGVLQMSSNLLVDRNVVKGQFISSEPNLGTVALPIRDEHEGSTKDDFKVFFRIKEQNSKNWLSTNSYSGGQFKELERFPFGFALINNSKGKTYSFELYSHGADAQNALTIASNSKIITHHQLNKSDLKKPVFAAKYLLGKIVYALQNINAIFSTLVYFLPFYCYFYLLHEGNKIKLPTLFTYLLLIPFIDRYLMPPVVKVINKLLRFLYKTHLIDEKTSVLRVPLITIIIFVIIIGEIFIIKGINNLLLLIIILVWTISVVLYKFRVDSSYLIAIIFLVVCLILYLFGLETYAEKAAVWTYLFLVVGALQMAFVFKSSKDKKYF